MFNKYTYDTEINTEIMEIEDAFGYKNKMEYDFRFNTILKSTDRNDEVTEFTIDNKGRNVTVRGAFEIESGKPYTIKYEYHPEAIVPYTKTLNYDPEFNSDIQLYSFYDGLGRVLQTKKTASLFTTPGSNDQVTFIVSGKTIYDGSARVVKQYQQTMNTEPGNQFTTTISTTAPIENIYDSKDRVIGISHPDGSSSSTIFSIQEVNGFPTAISETIDPLGKRAKVFSNARLQTISFVNFKIGRAHV